MEEKQKLTDEQGNYILQDNKITRKLFPSGKLSPGKALGLYFSMTIVAGGLFFWDFFVDEGGYFNLWFPVLAIIGLGLTFHAVLAKSKK